PSFPTRRSSDLLLLRPASTRLAAMLLLTFMVDAWAQLPVHSNHTMMKNVLLLAMAACAIRQMWRGGDWSAFFNDFAPTGRVLLLVTHGGDRPGDRIPLAAGAQ